VTIEHSATVHHELNLASADPFGFTYETHKGKSVTLSVDKVTFTTYPDTRDPHRGCHIYGQRILASGKLGAKVSKYIGVRYDREMWAQIPDDVKAVMRSHGFNDSADPQ
jgi:hypothetical protein